MLQIMIAFNWQQWIKTDKVVIIIIIIIIIIMKTSNTGSSWKNKADYK